MRASRFLPVFLLAGMAVSSTQAQSVRDHTRLQGPRDTSVSSEQAVDLTLTLNEVAVRPVQTWVRTGGTIDKSGRILTAIINGPDGAIVKVGQRVRAFPPESRSSMYQAKITRVTPQGSRVVAEATLPGTGRENSTRYVMEIVVDQGDMLSVPNEAIIEEGDKRIVYVQQHPGHYVPQEIHAGLQGELYTQILHGLEAGDQVVTFGSFFIDSEYKLKSSGQSSSGTLSNDHHHH